MVIALEILVLWDSMLKKENWELSFYMTILSIISSLLITAMNFAKEYIISLDIALQSQLSFPIIDKSNIPLSWTGLRI